MTPYRSSASNPAPCTIVELSPPDRGTSYLFCLLLGMLAAAVFYSCGCAAPDQLNRVLASGLRVASLTEGRLAKLYVLEQEECLRLPSPQAEECVLRVRESWRELREAYADLWRDICALEPRLCEEQKP